MRIFLHHRLRLPSLLGAIVLLAPCFLHAQTPGTGGIAGAVVDPTGAVLPNAAVHVVSQGTGWSRTTVTGADGLFRAPLLPPGEYSVVVSASGFQTKSVDSVHVVAGETTVFNVRLAVGTVASETAVVAAPEFAQTESSALGRVTDARTITALPLANRNFSQILALNPGVVVELPDAAALGKNTQNVSSNGAKTTANNFQFNGIDANNLSQGSFSGFDPEPGIAIPAPDTIAEFKVQTGMYDAGYGRSAGANVDFISRTGTNRFHGTLREFFRNDVLLRFLPGHQAARRRRSRFAGLQLSSRVTEGPFGCFVGSRVLPREQSLFPDGERGGAGDMRRLEYQPGSPGSYELQASGSHLCNSRSSD